MEYKATALTPLLVGDGRELSPIDYMVWKDQVNVLDQARIFRLLARGPRLEGYLAQLKKASKLDFASWGGFAQNFSQRRIPFENPGTTSIWNGAPTESLFIPTFAADHRGPYLPASALKGALRTGLVYSRFSAGTIERAAASLEGDRVPRRLGESAENAAGASQVRIVSIADSAIVPTSAFKIYLTRVASLDTRQLDTRELDTRQGGAPKLVWKVAGRGSVAASRAAESTAVFAEMATPGTSFSGVWEERKFLENSELSRALGWRSVPDLKTMLKASNDYAEAQLALHAGYAQATGLQALADTVRRLGQELESARAESASCLLCLGWGGGFLSKSAFLDTGSEPLRKILRAVPSLGRSVRDGVVFPKTRRLVFIGGQPSSLPGWTRLQFE